MNANTDIETTQKPTWHVETISCPALNELITRWYLDTPKHGDPIAEVDVIQVSGWALAGADRQSRLHLILRFRDRTQSLPFSVDRADVVEKVLDAEAENHPHIHCGFYYPVTIGDAMEGFELGFEIDGYIYVVAKISSD